MCSFFFTKLLKLNEIDWRILLNHIDNLCQIVKLVFGLVFDWDILMFFIQIIWVIN